MSQYAQIADLQNLAITRQAADRFGSTAMTAQLQAASAIADGYIGGQFDLPLQTSPQGWDMSLTLATCNIAAKLLYNQFGYGAGQANIDELIERRYVEAIDWLELVRDKKVQPKWAGATDTPGMDAAGDFIISDSPVGFTTRGVTSNNATCAGGIYWGWW